MGDRGTLAKEEMILANWGKSRATGEDSAWQDPWRSCLFKGNSPVENSLRIKRKSPSEPTGSGLG